MNGIGGLSERVRHLMLVTRRKTESGLTPAVVHCNGATWDTGPDPEMIAAAIAMLRDVQVQEETRLPPISAAAAPAYLADVVARPSGRTWRFPIAVGMALALGAGVGWWVALQAPTERAPSPVAAAVVTALPTLRLDADFDAFDRRVTTPTADLVGNATSVVSPFSQ